LFTLATGPLVRLTFPMRLLASCVFYTQYVLSWALRWRHLRLPLATVQLVVSVDVHAPSLHGAAAYGEHSENVLFHRGS